MKRLGFVLLALLGLGNAQAQVTVPVCHDYGCVRETDVRFDEWQIGALADVMLYAVSAADERQRLPLVMAQLYAWAGAQSPIWRDRGGNVRDEGMPGTMDCIDHSVTTTRFLSMLSELGLLRFHRVLPPQYRGRIFQHYAAVIEEVDARQQHAEEAEGGQYVVDSWFGDNGTPPLVMPIDEWREGGGPDV